MIVIFDNYNVLRFSRMLDAGMNYTQKETDSFSVLRRRLGSRPRLVPLVLRTREALPRIQELELPN
eukprot:scaffold128_cov248-Pinguiococcus_pyrenoidosus.AAC.16